MSAGMLMMMKSLGVDPEEVKKNIEGFKQEVLTGITTVDNRLSTIEKQNKQILFFAEQIYNACLNEVSSPSELLKTQLQKSLALESAIVGSGSDAEKNFQGELELAIRTT